MFWYNLVCGQGSGDSGCGTRRQFTSTCGSIDIQHGPSPGVATCVWDIEVPTGHVINITFTQFAVQYTGRIPVLRYLSVNLLNNG